MKEFMAGVLASLFSLFGSYGAVVQTAPVINSAGTSSSFEASIPAPEPMASTAQAEPAIPASDRTVVASDASQQQPTVPRSTDLSAYVTRAELDAALDQRLAPLSALVPALQQLISRWPTTAAAPTSVFVPSYSTSGSSGVLTTPSWAASQRIDNLSGTTISNPTITGGSISGASLSSPSVTGALSITDSGNSTATLGDERVTNGNFSSDPSSSWTLGSGWTWDSGSGRVFHAAGSGPIASISVDAGGAYYTNGDVITISGGSGDATYSTTVSGGKVTSLTEVSAGTGYTSGSGRATTGGTGSGLVVSINQISDAAPISQSLGMAGGDSLVTFVVSGYIGSGRIKVDLGNSSTYFQGTGTYRVMLQESTTIAFTPTADFYGALDNISVKALSYTGSILSLANPDGFVSLEFRPGGSGALFYNQFMGVDVGKSITTGFRNTGIGHQAFVANTEGFNNTVVGEQGLFSNTHGFNNTAVGLQTLYSNTTGNYNTANGVQSLYSNTTGLQNSAFGMQTMRSNTIGSNNTALGSYSLYNNVTGNQNTAVGAYSNYMNTTGSQNMAFGYQTLFSNTTGSNNTAMGHQAIMSNTIGNQNTGIGWNSLNSNATGNNNTAFGVHSLRFNVDGSNNVAVGHQSMINATTSENSVAIGYAAGKGASTNNNYQGLTALGYQSGLNLANGSDYNTLVGYQAGYGITTGSNNIWIGTATSSTGIANLTTGSQNILIGNNISFASTTANGQLNIGNILYGTGITGTGSILSSGSLGVGTTSPWRKFSVTGTVGFDGLTGATGAGSLCLSANREVVYNSASDSCLPSLRATKHDIAQLNFDALALVSRLEPVSFVYNDGDGRTRWGFIAEAAAAVDPHLATYDASSTISGIDDRSMLALIVRAVQKLVADMAGLADRITTRELTYVRAEGDYLGAKEISAHERLCVGATCVTEAQLQALLNSSGLSPAPGATPADPPADPAPEDAAVQDATTDDAPAIVPGDKPAPTDEEPASLP